MIFSNLDEAIKFDRLLIEAGRGPNRDDKIIDLFRKGKGLWEIGREFSISGERVRQILLKNKISPNEGGSHKKRAERIKSRLEKESKKYLRRYGCTKAELQTIPDRFRKRFPHFKINARHLSGQNCELTLWQWWSLLRDSGLAAKMRQGGACIRRIDRAKPYSFSNCYVAPCPSK